MSTGILKKFEAVQPRRLEYFKSSKYPAPEGSDIELWWMVGKRKAPG